MFVKQQMVVLFIASLSLAFIQSVLLYGFCHSCAHLISVEFYNFKKLISKKLGYLVRIGKEMVGARNI